MSRGALAAAIALASTAIGRGVAEVAQKQEEDRIRTAIADGHRVRRVVGWNKNGSCPKHRKWAERKERRRVRQQRARDR